MLLSLEPLNRNLPDRANARTRELWPLSDNTGITEVFRSYLDRLVVGGGDELPVVDNDREYTENMASQCGTRAASLMVS